MSRYAKAIAAAHRLQRRRTPISREDEFLRASKEPSIPLPLVEPSMIQKIDLAYALNITVGDAVQVMHGRDQGRHGHIMEINRLKNTVIVENCNLKHVRIPHTMSAQPTLTKVELPIHITNIALLDPVTKEPTRVKRRSMLNGEIVRISKLSGSAMPVGVDSRRRGLRKWVRETSLYSEYMLTG